MTHRLLKHKPGPLAGETGPSATLDGAVFLAEAQRVCAALAEDLRVRTDGSPGVTRRLWVRSNDEAGRRTKAAESEGEA
ncbi:hypothetical protein [Sorangium atrum]|uniref:Uncharacterized protein n=1 Tax=Sorangium atrum TaxID=2995308 RepID=A0ABT5CKI5_9BACT|nr:hypothetical protein [Sorangium aterium]MDC0685596.1 hypothetical protein [Sorangium aterium]